MPTLEEEFDGDMFNIYTRALKETGYNAARYLNMLHEHGSLETAYMLIDSSKVSDGYTALWEHDRLDLTVEALVYENTRYHPLFSAQQITKCEKRLRDYQYL